MCGICGYIGNQPQGDELLQRMADRIRHRGPDAGGVATWAGGGLAHRRLAIIDLTPGGAQPMRGESGALISYNGEIYNYREIRQELAKAGSRCVGDSDTEVLLRSWEMWGVDALSRFRGMFAFALWDPAANRLHLVRDRLGIKPLYYLEHDGTFYFASEIKALLAIPGYSPRVDRESLDLYLGYRYVTGERTMFSGIRKLLPGHRMEIDPDGTFRTIRYWSIPILGSGEPVQPEAEVLEEFWDTFSEAVRLRTIADVPLGAYLSGGLDSSLIVAALREQVGSVDCFSVGFAQEGFDESDYAREVAVHCGSRLHMLQAETSAVEDLEEIVYHLDEPLADLAVIPTYAMARATKPKVTVVLSGEGADELFGGYDKYRLFGRIDGYRSRLAALAGLARYLPLHGKAGRLADVLAAGGEGEAYAIFSSVFTPREMQQLRPAANQADYRERLIGVVEPAFSRERSTFNRMLGADAVSWLPDDLLLKNDKMTMAHAVEARVPYLDHRLVEFCARLPETFKLRNGVVKYLLRRSMLGRLPDRIVGRGKTGFSVPLGDWMDGPFGERIDAVTSPDAIRRQGLFDPETVSSLRRASLNDHYARRQFWTIAAFNLWQQRFRVEV